MGMCQRTACTWKKYYTIEREDSNDPVEAGKTPKKKPFVSPEKVYRVWKVEYLDPPSIGGYFGGILVKMVNASGELIGEIDLSNNEV